MADNRFTRLFGTGMVTLMQWVEGRPRWLRPPLYGALFIYAFMTLRGAWFLLPIVLVVLAITKPLTAWHFFVGIVILAPLGGFIGGLLYSITSPLTKYLGRTGTLVRCLLASLGYGVVLVFLIVPVLDEKPAPSLLDTAEWLGVALVALIGGLAIGIPMIRRTP